MKITKYTVYTDKPGIDIHAACVADLHSHPYGEVINAVKKISPDLILLPGDIVEIAADYMEKRNKNGMDFLSEAVKIAPTFYTYGNHEIYYSHAKGKQSKKPDPKLFEDRIEKISRIGVHLINDKYEDFEPMSNSDNSKGFHIGCDFHIGGVVCGKDKDPDFCGEVLNTDFIQSFSNLRGFKILLCHYPHYYSEYLKNTDVDLILSGHAHGGQWRIFGRGVFAPHQGLFPKYTSGLHDGKLLISRGASNNVPLIPRFFNPREVLDIHIISK